MRFNLLLLTAAVLFPTALAATAIDGNWTGRVTAPQGTAALALDFSRTAKGLAVAVHMPVMHVHGVKFGATESPNGTITIAALSTTLRLDGDELRGEFALGQLPVVLRRGGPPPPAPPAATFPAAPAPRWTYALEAPTWAAPLVHAGMVFVGASDGRFHAVHAASGKAAWIWRGENRIDGQAALGPDAVGFVDGKSDFVCLNRADGTLRWRAPLHDEAHAPRPKNDNPTFNRRVATATIVDDTVYVGSTDGGVYAFALNSGKLLSRFAAGSPVFSGIARDGGDRLLFGCMDGSVVTLDRHHMREIARVRAGGAVVTTPVLAGANLIVGGRDYALHAFRASDGAPAWKFSYWFSWVESTPALVDDTLYVGASDYRRVTAFDPADGAVRWATDVRGLAWGTPLVTPDRVFIGTVAQNLPGTAIAHEGGIMALDRATGAVKWRLAAAPAAANDFGGYAGSLALAGDLVIAAGFDGRLIALSAN